jgi:precorrin-6B methylase 2
LLRVGNNFLEIGTFDGIAVARLAQSHPGVTFYSVDSFEKAFATDGGHIDAVLENTADCSNFILVKGQSQRVLPSFRDAFFDVIFIDGDHGYEAVLTDINNACRIIKPGGHICMHDFALDTVSRAIDDSLWATVEKTVTADVKWCRMA